MAFRSTHDDPVLEEYTRLARRYDRRWSFYVSASVRETVRRLDLTGAHRILDVGCGTGVLLHVLSHVVPDAQLAGIDPCGAMLTVARRKIAGPVELREAGVE